MGTVHSDAAGEGAVEETDAGSEYVLISNKSEESLSFDPSQSCALAFCINRQTSPRFRHKQLSDTVVNDAFKVLSTLQEKGTVPRTNAKLIVAKLEPDSCTFAGMKNAFQEQAKRVGKEGAFFFHFSGHGIRVSNDQFGLAPVDFDYTENTYITASVLSQWLREANCEAKCVVFTIDCCYAGGLALALTRGSDKLTPFPGLYVMAACTANEVSVILGTLGNSIFCYFLSHAIQNVEFSPGHFPVRSIYEKCKKLSIALSSLLLSYDKTSGVSWKTMQPELAQSTLTQTVLELSGEGNEQTDAGIMRFSYATELYDSTSRGGIKTLNDKCCNWLELTYVDSNGGLSQLREEGILGQEQCVMDTVLCCMLRSVASIQLDCDSTTVASPNLYLTAYMRVVTVISYACSGAKFDVRECVLGLLHYQHCLQQHKIDTQSLLQLYREALKLLNPRGGIRADSGVPEEDDPGLPEWPAVEMWTPLEP
jgi:hypothetical protein